MGNLRNKLTDEEFYTFIEKLEKNNKSTFQTSKLKLNCSQFAQKRFKLVLKNKNGTIYPLDYQSGYFSALKLKFYKLTFADAFKNFMCCKNKGLNVEIYYSNKPLEIC